MVCPTTSHKKNNGYVLTDLRDTQRQRNFDTQGNWERSQAHREQITAKLLERDSEALLRVFGAGNSNDLDLKQLSRHYTQIELVDIDSEALAYGYQSQGISDKDGVELLADVDLSGHQFQHTARECHGFRLPFHPVNRTTNR